MTQAVATGTSTSLVGARRVAEVATGYLAAVMTVGVIVQVFLAGMGVFGLDGADVEKASSLDPHRTLGNVLGIVAILVLLTALAARRSWVVMLTAFVLAVLTEAAQHGLASAGNDHSWAGGLHAADGLLILGLAAWLAVPVWRRVGFCGLRREARR
ncbi:MAG: DUF6220 domain-containing protein [Sciscionella sp.]